MRDLDQPVFLHPKDTDSWHARKGDLQHAFPLDILMIPSSAITVAADGECLMCDGFSLGEMVRLGNIEFITDYFRRYEPLPQEGRLRHRLHGLNSQQGFISVAGHDKRLHR
jgi:hypothetical protein